MATNKANSAKKSKTTSAKKQSTAKVTTVKATSTKPKGMVKGSTKRLRMIKGNSPFTASLIAEFIGTFILGSVALAVQGNPLYIGFALIAIVLIIGGISGSHVNPLVTIGAWVTRRISGKRALGYLAAQILGAMLALVVMSNYAGLMGTADLQTSMISGQQGLFEIKALTGEDKGVWHVFFAEMIGALIFGFAVASAMQEKKDRTAQAFAIGFGLLVALAIAGGAAIFAQAQVVVNPALAITLQAIKWPIKDIFPILIHVISPILGGAIGFFLYDLIRNQQDSETRD